MITLYFYSLHYYRPGHVSETYDHIYVISTRVGGGERDALRVQGLEARASQVRIRKRCVDISKGCHLDKVPKEEKAMANK